jgi:hypothetical protein
MPAFRFTVTIPGQKPFEQQTGPHTSAYAAITHLRQIHPEGTPIEGVYETRSPDAPNVASAVTSPESPVVIEPGITEHEGNAE